MADESGGILWRTLSKEEDILSNVLKMLNATSLKNLELTCKAFRRYIKTKQLWQKRFMKINFYVFKYGTRYQILLNVTKSNLPSELHVKYKRICLSLETDLKVELCSCRLCSNQGCFFPRCDAAQIKRAMYHAHYQQQIDEEDIPMQMWYSSVYRLGCFTTKP